MTRKPSKGSKDLSELRSEAEQLLSKHIRDLHAPTPEEVQELVYELEVHRIELEMQNEQLRETQQQLEVSRDRYAHLYDLAPMGYLSHDEHGHILGINLTAARLLKKERVFLMDRPFASFLVIEDKKTFRSHLRQCVKLQEPVTCEVALHVQGGPPLAVQLHTVPVEDARDGLMLYRTAITDIAERKRIEEALRKAHNELEQRVQERTAELLEANLQLRQEVDIRKRAEEDAQIKQELLRQLLEVHERDRQLIAYEIHDGFVQPLAAALMHCEGSLRAVKAKYPEAVPGACDRAVDLFREALDAARRLMGGLRPALLDELGVVAAIDSLARDSHGEQGPEIEYTHEVQFNRLATPLENTIFRIVQECLTNALRHSKSDRVRVVLLEISDRLRLEVEDWGIGFDSEKVSSDRFGLRGIRERAHLFGGRAVIDSSPGKGTLVTVELPLLGTASQEAPDHRGPYE